MPCKLFDVAPEDLELGPIQPGTSGAQANFHRAYCFQTPWMRVERVQTHEDGKVTLFLRLDDDTAQWLCGVEERAQADLTEEVRARWKSSCHQGTWKWNVARTVPRFGAEAVVGCYVALAFELVGVWFWSEWCGLKTKVLQLKGVSGRGDGS